MNLNLVKLGFDSLQQQLLLRWRRRRRLLSWLLVYLLVWVLRGVIVQNLVHLVRDMSKGVHKFFFCICICPSSLSKLFCFVTFLESKIQTHVWKSRSEEWNEVISNLPSYPTSKGLSGIEGKPRIKSFTS